MLRCCVGVGLGSYVVRRRGVIQDPTYEDPSSRVLKSAAAGRMRHSEDWKNIGCGREGAVWTLTEPKETDLRRDLPPEVCAPTVLKPVILHWLWVAHMWCSCGCVVPSVVGLPGLATNHHRATA